jgi:hypothetical protein
MESFLNHHISLGLLMSKSTRFICLIGLAIGPALRKLKYHIHTKDKIFHDFLTLYNSRFEVNLLWIKFQNQLSQCF